MVEKIPLLPLRGVVVFPYMLINLDIGRARSLAAVKAALDGKRRIFVVAQLDPDDDEPTMNDLYQTGTLCEVRHMVEMPNGSARVVLGGLVRAHVAGSRDTGTYTEVDLFCYEDSKEENDEIRALNKAVIHQFEEWVRVNKHVPPEAIISIAIMDDTSKLSDVIAAHLTLKFDEMQLILNHLGKIGRLKYLLEILMKEVRLSSLEKNITSKVRKEMDKHQKDYFLREKLKAIHKELGDDDDYENEGEEIRQRMEDNSFPDYVKKAVEKELKRLHSMAGAQAEAALIHNYIDTIMEMPWTTSSVDNVELAEAEKILDADHYGLEKIKERIVEYLAVHKLCPDKPAPILCLVGPPGVGKTSLATSVARATGRKFVRSSLGGVRDEAEIRGHRRTYVGAMPGRIIQALRNAGTNNPVFLLDEVDKMDSEHGGDPTSALLEVLDPAQNSTFRDHFLDLPFDLSKVLWIVTANNLANIPRPLRDRMEIITLDSYTEIEKLEIAKRFLVGRQRTNNGLKAKDIRIGTGVLEMIIAQYTKEAGVRELERVIGHVCRKAACQIVEGEKTHVSVTVKNLTDFLGKPKYLPTKGEKKPQVGVCTGMAWTEVGGEILPTEVCVLKGNGKLILTGKLGDVMQESAQAGLSYIRSRADKFSLPEDFYQKDDIHIHLAEGAVPKDGPSAGITMATAMVSALTQRKIRSDVAMTGEITLRGNVLPIGGLKEKVLAAYREGMHTIILPKENERDIEDIPQIVREKLEFVPVETMDEVLGTALLDN